MLRLSLLLLAASAFSHAADETSTTTTAIAGVENVDRARVDYMLNCQGCHGPTGTGSGDGVVPNMKGFVGNFLHSRDGREFLVRVPGSANSALDNTRLAEVLNWILATMSPEQLPASFKPFSATEVGKLRKRPLTEIQTTREALLATFSTSVKPTPN